MDKVKTLLGFLKNEKNLSILFLSLAIIFNAVFLWSEVVIPTFSLNDEVLHLSVVREALSVFKLGQNPTDFWFSQIGLGYPLFHHYQHLPHLILTFIGLLGSSLASLLKLFDISRYLLLVFFPLSVFWAMRRLDFNYLAAGASALVSSLFSTPGLYGLDYGSYIWRGAGLYSQLWAMFFLPLALAEIYRAIFYKNGSWFWPVFLSVIVLLSNLLYGYILILSALLLLFLKLDKAEFLLRLKRLAPIFILIAAISAYFFIPFVLGRDYLNRSVWEEQFKYNSFGIVWVLKNLFTGNLFDFGRGPVLTALFFLSIALAIKEWKKENHRFLVILTLFWLFLFFGRSSLGLLVDILPFSRDLHFHRFVGGFHFAALLLIGVGFSLVWQWLRNRYPRVSVILITAILLIVLLPAFIERVKFYQQNALWKTETQKAFFLKDKEITEIEKTLKNLPAGRVYAGLPADFGNDASYKIGSVPLYSLLPQLGVESFGYAFFALPLSSDIRLHFDNAKIEQYNLFNIRYVLLNKTWTPPDYYLKIKEFEDYVLYQVPTTGYFDLVDAPAVFYGSKNDFYSPNSQWLSSFLPKLKQHPILEIDNDSQKISGLPVFSFQEVDEKIISDLALADIDTEKERGGIVSESAGANQYWAQFFVNRDCYLMLKTNFHPGWQASLDYQKVEPVMLAPGFIGIKVSPGVHQALFLYKPPAYRLPLALFGVLLLIVLFFGQRIRNFFIKLKMVK